jgi:hypothetical protein
MRTEFKRSSSESINIFFSFLFSVILIIDVIGGQRHEQPSKNIYTHSMNTGFFFTSSHRYRCRIIGKVWTRHSIENKPIQFQCTAGKNPNSRTPIAIFSRISVPPQTNRCPKCKIVRKVIYTANNIQLHRHIALLYLHIAQL